MYSEYLLRKYKELFGENFREILEKDFPKSIRINTLKISVKDFIERIRDKMVLEKISYTKYGFYVLKSKYPIGATVEYLLGYYAIQDPASMYAVEVLEPKPGEIVLDMASAPGMKTSYIAQLMKNKGCIIAFEINRDRMRGLRSNLTRLGCENVILIRDDARNAKNLGIKFDKVLLDAPCTGTGTLNKNPEARYKDEKDVMFCTNIQRELLKVAIDVTKTGGIIVYSTCSLLPEENEFIINEFLEKYDIKLEEIKFGDEAFTKPYGIELCDEIRKCKRFYPGKHLSQGFFISKIKVL